MSDKALARRTEVKIYFNNKEISSSIEKYLLSLTYTDNEEEETDDIQIKLQDRDGIWLEKWLNEAIESTVNAGNISSLSNTQNEYFKNSYTVTANCGLNVRSGMGTRYKKLGVLPFGTKINVKNISGNWAEISYSNQTAYVCTDYLKEISPNTGTWSIGQYVTVSGKPQYTSYGEGTPGEEVENYSGTITNLNIKNNAPYPIHIGSLGWFSVSQVQEKGAGNNSIAETLNFSGAEHKGMSIQAVILKRNWNSDGKDELLECGSFELDSVQASGPPNTITIKATSLPFSSTIRQMEKSKSWEAYSFKGICEEIAAKNGMSCIFSSSVNPTYKRVEQYKMSDILFLKKLCNDNSCSLKISNNIIVIFNQAEFEKKSSIKTINRNSNNEYSSYRFSTSKDNTYTSCKVVYFSPNGNLITGIAYVEDFKDDDKNNKCLQISQKVESIAEANDLAKNILKKNNKFAIQASFVFPGDVNLIAGRTVQLKSFGALDGKYIIKQAKHSISRSGYQTQITLRKVF